MFALFKQPGSENDEKYCEIVQLNDKDIPGNAHVCFCDNANPDYYSISRDKLTILYPSQVIALLNSTRKPKRKNKKLQVSIG